MIPAGEIRAVLLAGTWVEVSSCDLDETGGAMTLIEAVTGDVIVTSVHAVVAYRYAGGA